MEVVMTVLHHERVMRHRIDDAGCLIPDSGRLNTILMSLYQILIAGFSL
jgi:hypothetical protein